MGKLFTMVRELPMKVKASVAIVAAAVIVPAAVFAYGPERPTYTMEKPADHVTFNSITNNPNIGDERNFVTIREQGTNGTWNDNQPVQAGKSYVVRMYVHNNAASNLNKVAENVTAKFNLPTTTAKSIDVNGFLSASNATPQEVYDSAKFTSDQNFNLAYQANTLKYENNVFGTTGAALSESIFTNSGVKLGYDKLDGKIPGCLQYAGYLTFVVKPQFAPTNTFEVQKQVRKAGDTAWQKTVATNPGDTVEYQLTYRNTGATEHKNVLVQDTLPAGLNYVNGSSFLKNSYSANPTQISDNVTKSVGVNIGNYVQNDAAYVKFSAKVADNNSLPLCGANTLTNKVRITANGGYKEDTAVVTVNKQCQPGKINVCDLTTKKVISINASDFDSKKHSKNLADCNATPTTPNTPSTPTELPQTGISTGVMTFAGLGLITAGLGYAVTSSRIRKLFIG